MNRKRRRLAPIGRTPSHADGGRANSTPHLMRLYVVRYFFATFAPENSPRLTCGFGLRQRLAMIIRE